MLSFPGKVTWFCLLFLFFTGISLQIVHGKEKIDSSKTSEDIEQITISAQRQHSTNKSVSAQVSIIDAEQIKNTAPRNLAEVVSQALGVEINRYGGISEMSVISIRGSSAEQVLVLVNGKRLNSAQGGGVNLSTINPEDIERIEIIRGGGSAIHGENAFGGVLNIITKDGYGKQFSGGLQGGYASFNTASLSAQLMDSFGPDQQLDYFFSISGLYTEGNYTFPDPHALGGTGRRQNSQGLAGDISFKGGWDLDKKEGIRLSFSMHQHYDKKGVPGLKEFPTPSATMEDTRHLGMLSLIYPLSKTFELGLDLYGIKQLRSYQDPDFYLGLVDDSHDNKTGGWDLEIHQTNKWKKIKIDTVSGYNLRYDHLISTGLLTAEEASKESGRISRLSHNGYSRADFHFFLNTPSKGLEQKGGVQGRLVLSPALRLESSKLSYGQRQVQQPQDAFSYSLGWRVAIDRQNLVVIKGNAGTAFRNPTFNDLFWPATSFALGNPQLKPERMFIFDTGVNIKPFPFISLEAVGFLHQARDLIQWNPGAAGLWQPQNIGKARIWGLELEAALLLEIPWLQGFGEVKVNYSFLAAQDKTEGTPSYNRQLPRRAKEKFNLLINYTNYQGHSLNLNGRYVGHRYITAQNTKYLDPYLVVDGTCTFYLKEKIYLIFTVKNLLGTRYVDIREFPVPGREGGIKLGVQF